MRKETEIKFLILEHEFIDLRKSLHGDTREDSYITDFYYDTPTLKLYDNYHTLRERRIEELRKARSQLIDYVQEGPRLQCVGLPSLELKVHKKRDRGVVESFEYTKKREIKFHLHELIGEEPIMLIGKVNQDRYIFTNPDGDHTIELHKVMTDYGTFYEMEIEFESSEEGKDILEKYPFPECTHSKYQRFINMMYINKS